MKKSAVMDGANISYLSRMTPSVMKKEMPSMINIDATYPMSRSGFFVSKMDRRWDSNGGAIIRVVPMIPSAYFIQLLRLDRPKKAPSRVRERIMIRNFIVGRS